MLLSDQQEVRLQREFPGALYNAAAEALELPMPRGGDLVGWTARQLRTLFAGSRPVDRGARRLASPGR